MQRTVPIWLFLASVAVVGCAARACVTSPVAGLIVKLLASLVKRLDKAAKFKPILDEIRDPGWFWDTEFMVRAVRRGLRVEEIPGAYVRRFDKTSTVSGIRDSARYFGKLVAFRRALSRGRET